MHVRSAKWALVLLLVVCVGSGLSAWAQSTSTGTVAGSVTDPSGALVSGAEVTLTDTATNVARSTTTNATNLLGNHGRRPRTRRRPRSSRRHSSHLARNANRRSSMTGSILRTVEQ